MVAYTSDAAVPDTEQARFLNDYAAAVCAMYEPCCGREGLGYDGAGCTTWFRKVTAAYFKGTFQQSAADSCLAELANVRAADPDRCANVLDFDKATLRDSCKQAFGPAARDGKALGEKCLLASECMSMPMPDATVICYGGVCLLERHGRAGDGPCYIGGNSGISGIPQEVARCEADDGLYCHRANNVCTEQVGDGEYCPYPGACRGGGTCSGGRCSVLPGPGEPCKNAVPGAGGFCRVGSACVIETLLCGDALPEGASCREPAQCASGACIGGKCIKPEFTRALNCTGGE